MENTTPEAVAEDVVAAPVEQTTETTEVVETPPSWYEARGYASEEEFDNDHNGLKDFKTKAADAEKVIQYAKEIQEDPVPDDFKSIIALSKQTGIKDLGTLAKVMTAGEALANNPIEALSLQLEITNPDKYAKLGGKIGVEEMIREKYNLPSEGEYTPTRLMVADSIDALEAIEKIKTNVQQLENPYTFVAAKKLEEAQVFEKRQTSAIGELEKLAKGLKEVTYNYTVTEGEKGKETEVTRSVIFKVSEDEINTVLNESKPLAHNFDVSNKIEAEQMREWAHDQVLLKKLKSGALGAEIEKSVQARSDKNAVKEVHNGQPKVVEKVGVTTSESKELTPTQKELIAMGRTPPSMKPQKE